MVKSRYSRFFILIIGKIMDMIAEMIEVMIEEKIVVSTVDIIAMTIVEMIEDIVITPGTGRYTDQ